MKVEIHLLQQFPPSCLNRDDTGAPKNCLFGGYPRARVSSQCLKRAMRLHMNEAGGLEGGVRTRILAHRLGELLGEHNARDGERAALLSRLALRAAGFSTAPEAPQKTLVALFVTPREIDALAAAVDADWELLEEQQQELEQQAAAKKSDPDRSRKQAEKKEERKPALPSAPHMRAAVDQMAAALATADIGLFGRMVAENSHMQVNAAAQVAHALSTHEVNGAESDYFTAVDDLQTDEGEERGAAMIGNIDYCSACFYRYAAVDYLRLVANLGGDAPLARRTVVALLAAAVEALPTGRQNSTAAHCPPDYIQVVLRPGLSYSLVNAFEEPVWPRRQKGSLMRLSWARLRDHQARLEHTYPSGPGTERAVSSTLEGVGDMSFPELLGWLNQRLGEHG